MTIDRHVGHCMLRKALATPSNSIWISDALLAESIQRFTCVHRRYGSSVPGPLEARRRATRRKNTSLASGGGGAPSIEIAALFGQGSKPEWWNVSNSSEPQAGTARCESDLFMCLHVLMKLSAFNTTLLAHQKISLTSSEYPIAQAIGAR